MNLGFF